MVGQQGGFFHEFFRELFTVHTAQGEAIQHSSGCSFHCMYLVCHCTPGRGKIVPHITLLVGEKLCRVI